MQTNRSFQKQSLLPILLVLALLIAACGPEESSAPLEPAELTWRTFDLNNRAEDAVIQKYQETHPEITFKREGMRGGPFGGLDVTPPPDLMMFTANFDYLQAVRNEQLADLSELWEQAELADKIPNNIRSLIEVDGKPFMTPTAINWSAIYYNKQVFAQAGVQPPKTWEEFTDVCEKLLLAGEVPIVVTGTRSYSYLLWFDLLNIRLNGAQFHRDLLDGKEKYDDPRVVEVFNRWRTLFERGYFVEHPELLSDLAASNGLIRDDKGMLTGPKAAMMLIDAITVSEMPAKFREELDFFPFPTIDPAIPPAESATVVGYVVPRGSDHPVQTLAFLNYINSPEAQTMLLQPNQSGNAAFVPARSDVDRENMAAQMVTAIEYLQNVPVFAPQTFIWMPREMWNGFNSGYTKFLRNQEYDIAIFVEELQKAQDKARESGAYGE